MPIGECWCWVKLTQPMELTDFAVYQLSSRKSQCQTSHELSKIPRGKNKSRIILNNFVDFPNTRMQHKCSEERNKIKMANIVKPK